MLDGTDRSYAKPTGRCIGKAAYAGSARRPQYTGYRARLRHKVFMWGLV